MNRNNYLYTILLFLLLLPVGHAIAAPATYTRAQVDSIVAAEVSRQLAAEQIDLKIERSANERYAQSIAEQTNRIAEQENLLEKHDHEMSSRYTWMGVIFTFLGLIITIVISNFFLGRVDKIADNNELRMNQIVGSYAKRMSDVAYDNEKKIYETVEAKTKVIDARTTELNAKSDELDKQTKDLQTKTADLDQKASDLSNKQKELDEKSAKLDAQMRELNQKIAEMDKKIEDHDEKLNKASEEIKENVEKARVSELISQAFTEEDLKKKIELLSKAIDMDPGNDKAYNYRGYAYGDIGDYDKSIEDHTKAIELNSENKIAYINRGWTYNKKGEYDKAIEDFKSAIQIDSQDPNPYRYRGTSYRYKKEWDQAISDYTTAIEHKPKMSNNNYGGAYYNRGLAYQGKANQEKDESKKAEYTQLAEADFKKAEDLGYKP